MGEVMDEVLSGEAIFGTDGLLMTMSRERDVMLERNCFELRLPKDGSDSGAYQARAHAVRQSLILMDNPRLRPNFFVLFAMMVADPGFRKLKRSLQFFQSLRCEVIQKRKLGHIDYGYFCQPSVVRLRDHNDRFKNLCSRLEELADVLSPSLESLAFAGCDSSSVEWHADVLKAIQEFYGSVYQPMPSSFQEWKNRLDQDVAINHTITYTANRWFPTDDEKNEALRAFSYNELFHKGIANSDLWLIAAKEGRASRFSDNKGTPIRKTKKARGEFSEVTSLHGILLDHIPSVMKREREFLKKEKDSGLGGGSRPSAPPQICTTSPSSTMFAQGTKTLWSFVKVLSLEERLVVRFCVERMNHRTSGPESIDYVSVAKQLKRLTKVNLLALQPCDAESIKRIYENAMKKLRQEFGRS